MPQVSPSVRRRHRTVAARAALLLAALAVAGCTDPGRFGAGGGMGEPIAAVPADPSAGAPPPGTAAYFEQVVGDRVLFAVDQSSLSDEARGVLAQQARWLADNPGFTAVIEGHADEQGTREYNLALGARRANSVQEYLVSQGVAPARLRTVTFGKERPLAICSEESCYAQNRRAVTVLAAGPAAGA